MKSQTFHCFSTLSVNYTYVASVTTIRTEQSSTAYPTSTQTANNGTYSYTVFNSFPTSGQENIQVGGGSSSYVNLVYSTMTITSSSSASYVYRTARKTIGLTTSDFNTRDVKMSQLGITDGTLTIKNNATGATAEIMITATTSVADFISSLEFNGFDADFSGGRLKLSTDQDLVFVAGSSNVLDVLGLQAKVDYKTFSQNATSNKLNNITVKNMATTTTIGVFAKTAADRILELSINNVSYAKTFAATHTVGDVLNYFNSL